MTNATGYQAWQDIWGKENPQDIWVEPDKDVLEMIPQLRMRDARRVLDIGCGLGRHIIPFAKQGFSVDGIDASTTGVARAGALATSNGVQVTLSSHSLTMPTRLTISLPGTSYFMATGRLLQKQSARRRVF